MARSTQPDGVGDPEESARTATTGDVPPMDEPTHGSGHRRRNGSHGRDRKKYRVAVPGRVADELVRIATAQIDAAIDEFTAPDLPLGERVHRLRKRGKKLRAVLRLGRDSFAADYSAENAHLRDMARLLGPLRDADVARETLDSLADPDAHAELRRHLDQRRELALRASDARLAAVAEQLTRARDRIVGTWRFDNCDCDFDVVAGGFVRTFRRGRKAMARALEQPTVERLHEWRKRAKYHGHHLRLLRGVWPDVLGKHASAAKDLGSMLGELHDMDMLRLLLDRWCEPGQGRSRASYEIQGACVLRRDALRHRASAAGRFVFAEAPAALAERLHRYWSARSNGS